MGEITLKHRQAGGVSKVFWACFLRKGVSENAVACILSISSSDKLANESYVISWM